MMQLRLQTFQPPNSLKFGAIPQGYGGIHKSLKNIVKGYKEFELICILLGTRAEMLVGSVPLNHAFFEVAMKAQREADADGMNKLLALVDTMQSKLTAEQLNKLVADFNVPWGNGKAMHTAVQGLTDKTVWEDKFEGLADTPTAKTLFILLYAKAAGKQKELTAALQPLLAGNADLPQMTGAYESGAGTFEFYW